MTDATTDTGSAPSDARARELQEANARHARRQAAKRQNAAAREAHNASIEGTVDRRALRDAMQAYLAEHEPMPESAPVEADSAGDRPLAAPAPLLFPTNNTNRWVPIGPSAVRRGQAEGRPRVSGRVRSLAVSPNGQRIYAGTAKGGVWYSGDAGATWEPVGGWANEPRLVGGNVSAFSCGCLLVAFGGSVATDFVMAGTGEVGAFTTSANAAPMGGLGILSGLAVADPATNAVQADPWEPATGVALLERLEIRRMDRVPGGPGAGTNGDRVVAATDAGLVLGTRAAGSYAWATLPGPPSPPSPPAAAPGTTPNDPTDLAYVGNRLFICYRNSGLAFSDDNGTTFTWVALPVPAGQSIQGRLSLAVNDDGDRVYVLGETTAGGATPTVWQVNNPGQGAPTAPAPVALAGAPSAQQLWRNQRDYDQAIVVTTHTDPGSPPLPAAQARIDRVFIAGSLFRSAANAASPAPLTAWNAAIYGWDVVPPPPAPQPPAPAPPAVPLVAATLNPARGVSDQPVNTTDATPVVGLVGENVHPDVHALHKATNADQSRQIWVGCDGGVFASFRNGQSNTFVSRNVGLASIEAGFIASHPTSSGFMLLGCQDNGRQVRVGESVWELKTTMQGDGGGVAFHPVRSEYVLGQFARGAWACDPSHNYVRPLVADNPANANPDLEAGAAEFYSGIDTIVQPAGNQARIALGTTRVWITDDLGTANPNTWRVLPITAGTPPVATAAIDPRPGRIPNPPQAAFGVPPGLGTVITVKWVNPTTLLALYQQGVVRYTETGAGTNLWTGVIVFQIGGAAPAAPLVLPAAGNTFTDIAPVPGTNDFYLVCNGQTAPGSPGAPAIPNPPGPPTPAVPAVLPTRSADTCFFWDNTAGGFRTTGLTNALLGLLPFFSPIDPAYSVVVHPTNANQVYVGTVTGVWQSTRGPAPGNAHGVWTALVNGLPESTVQDLSFWTDPAGAAGSPVLLRAATQSRGVWEVDLATAEPQRTYVRVHARDDRRILPTSLANPRRRTTAPPVSATASPDIVIRPEAPVTNTPSFRGTNLVDGSLTYQLWTFQTAFRWLFPAVIPDGLWTDQFGDLVERHRRAISVANPDARRVDRALWNAVMAAAVDENGAPGVYRAPWQTGLAPALPATELDMMESVVPRRDANGIWQVYRERSTVDVLVHHRDTSPVAPNGTGVALLFRSGPSAAALRAADCTGIPGYAQSLFTVNPNPVPAGWTAVQAADGTDLHRLPIALGARMPRAVSINLDLSGIPQGHRVMLLALAGSTLDQFSGATAGPIDRVDRFVRHWPHAAARLISVWRRPGTQLF